MQSKYITGILLVSMLAGLLPACKKGYLDRNPTDAISSGTFWKSNADVQMAMAGVYRRLQGGFFGNRKIWLDAYSDNALDRHSFYGFGELSQGVVNPNNVTTTFYDGPLPGYSFL